MHSNTTSINHFKIKIFSNGKIKYVFTQPYYKTNEILIDSLLVEKLRMSIDNLVVYGSTVNIYLPIFVKELL